MRAAESVPVTASLALLLACGGGDSPSEPVDTGPPDLTRDGTVQGILDYDRLEIPAGVTITVVGPLVLNVAGDTEIAGTLSGSCVPITVNGRGAVNLRGTIRNGCGELPEGESPPALAIVADGDMTIDGATLTTSGDLDLRNDPTLTEAAFAVPPQASTLPGLPRAAQTGRTFVVRNARFIADPERARDGQPGQNGTNGLDAANWRLLAQGDLLLGGGNVIQGQSGGHGGPGDHTGAPASASGGSGGDGGRISVLATGSLAIGGTVNSIVSGSGGQGGSAKAQAAAGPDERAPAATATGGDGGDPGLVRLEGQQGFSSTAALSVTVGVGGDGGTAEAIAADGQASVCVDGTAQHGGHATAVGGDGGSSPDRRLRELGAVILTGEPTVQGGHGGAGGMATARGGDGASGPSCETCPNGGGGGDFEARGGDGGHARIRDLEGELVGDGGDAGESVHQNGNGGDGADCCSLPVAPGGDGGLGGSARGGDGAKGTGREQGRDGGVTIGSGDGGNGGDGVAPGEGGAGGNDQTQAIGEKRLVGGPFTPGTDGQACPTGVPSGPLVAGTFQLSASLVSVTGTCSFPSGFTNPEVHIDFEDGQIIVHSDADMVGDYDPAASGNGQWTGSGQVQTSTLGHMLRETLAGEWKVDNGSVRFEGTLTYEVIDPAGQVICTAVYVVLFIKNE